MIFCKNKRCTVVYFNLSQLSRKNIRAAVKGPTRSLEKKINVHIVMEVQRKV